MTNEKFLLVSRRNSEPNDNLEDWAKKQAKWTRGQLKKSLVFLEDIQGMREHCFAVLKQVATLHFFCF